MNNSFSIIKFKALGQFFLSDIEKQKVPIEKKVDQVIKNNLFEILREYRLSGYTLTPQQLKQLESNMLNLSLRNMVEELKKDIEKGVTLSEHELVEYFTAFSSLGIVYNMATIDWGNENSFENKHDFKYAPIVKVYHEKMQDPTFSLQLMNKWDKEFNHYLFDRKLANLELSRKYKHGSVEDSFVRTNLLSPMLQYNKEILAHKSIDELNQINDKLMKISIKADKIAGSFSNNNHVAYPARMLKRRIDDVIEYRFQKDLEGMKQDIELAYVEDHMDILIIKESLKMIENNNVKDLPKIARELLFDIKANYIVLHRKINTLSEQEQFTLENLWEKRIPEIISKYLHIDKEDRLTMFNRNNQNAEQLMIDSLKNINTNFKEMKNDKNEAGLSSLSATHKYTQNIKKSII